MGKGIVGSPTNIHVIPKGKHKDWIKPYRFTKEYEKFGKYKYHHVKRKKKKLSHWEGEVKKNEWFENLKKEYYEENYGN